jgi:peroxiredoxin
MRHSNRRRYLPFLLFGAIALISFTRPVKFVNDFSLLNVNGKYVSLKDYPDAKGFIIVFTCNHCPFARLYPARMNALNKKYASLGVPLIAISSSDTVSYEDDTYPAMAATAKQENYNFPYLFDGTQKVAENFAAQKTPNAFVIWKENGQWAVKYTGAIDDNGAEPDKVTHAYVQDAVDELLKGDTVSLAATRSVGCQIQFRATGK